MRHVARYEISRLYLVHARPTRLPKSLGQVIIHQNQVEIGDIKHYDIKIKLRPFGWMREIMMLVHGQRLSPEIRRLRKNISTVGILGA